MPAGVGLSLVAGPLVALAFGAGWEQAVPVLRILSLSFTIMVFGHLSLHLLSAHAMLGRLVGITLAGAAVRVGLLLLLIPGFGLVGAAAGVAVAVVLEQALTVATAMRRFRVGIVAMLRGVWRPAVASAAMAAVLAGLGLSSNLAAAAALGATIYATVVLAAWITAGRPKGAEADLLTLIRPC